MITNSLHRTKIVSFPRSGHHLLVRGLQAVFESELVYSEFYKSKHNMSNCKYVNVQKSHDFDLDEVIDPELRYVVLLREEEEAMTSWYKQAIIYEGQSKIYPDFMAQKTEYYKKFKEKYWNIRGENIIVIYFPYFIQDKFLHLIGAANFISTKPLTPYQIIAAKAWEKRESLGY
jgi:hypothetical protein